MGGRAEPDKAESLGFEASAVAGINPDNKLYNTAKVIPKTFLVLDIILFYTDMARSQDLI